MLNNFLNQKHFKSSFNVSKYFNILSFNLKELKMTLFCLFQTDNFPHLKVFLFFQVKDELMSAIEAQHMGPFYKVVCKDLKWTEDLTLSAKLAAENEKALKEMVSKATFSC